MRQFTDDEIVERFKVRFPRCWARHGSEWDADGKGLFWTGEGSEVTQNDTDDSYQIDAFNNYAYEQDPNEEVYQCGIHLEIVKFAQEHGIFFEWYDGGTVFAYRI